MLRSVKVRTNIPQNSPSESFPFFVDKRHDTETQLM